MAWATGRDDYRAARASGRRRGGVVPVPDPTRWAVPKAYVSLASGWPADRVTADIRRIEFMELPKTISGKIRRVELRARENSCQPDISAGAYRDR